MTATFNPGKSKPNVPEHYRGADLMLEGLERGFIPDGKNSILMTERDAMVWAGVAGAVIGLALAGGLSKNAAGDMFGDSGPVSDQNLVQTIDNIVHYETPD